MDALDALLSRVSSPRLTEPAPQGDAREQIFRAALRAPDHGRLRGWRFLVVEGERRTQLGEALARAMRNAQPETGEQVLEQLAAGPLRAPLVVVLVTRISEHPKVPMIEQQLSLACAAENMMLAAHALGFGAYWRTGPVTYVDTLNAALGLAAADHVGGFLYLGTPEGPVREAPALDPADFFVEWPSIGS